MAKTTVGAIAHALAEGAKLWNQWLSSRDRRKMEAAIDAAEQYIFTNEDPLLTDKRRQKLLKHYCKRFFKYN